MGGNSESKPGQENKEQEPRVNHPRFQNIKFTRNKEDEDRIQVKLPVASIKEYNQWVQALKDAPTQSQNFLLPQSYQFQKQGFCGSAGFVNVLFENFPYVLSDEIRNRASLKQKYFDQPELWYLIYTLLSAAHQFHKNGKKVGDVRPQNVFINQDGQVKVATKLTWPAQYENYHKTFYQKQPTYLAPEQLKDIQFAKMQPSCDPKLAQSFSVGLTCLDAGTLSSSTSLYNKNNKFDYNGLSQKLLELQNAGYSQILCLIVSNLCEPDSERRSTCSELQKWLEPHQQNIINLERFEVLNLPQKVALYGLGQQPQEPQKQTPGQTVGQISPQQVSYSRQTADPAILNGSQNVRIEQHHYTYPPQVYAQGVLQGGQPVTYYQPQPQPFQTQNPVQAPTRLQFPPQQVIQQVIQQPQQQVQPLPVQKIDSNPPAQVQNQITQNRTINTTSTYTYSGIPQSQYINNVPVQGNTQYTTQTVTYTRESGDRPKSNMQLTLQKIDEQLQMSRKMFPS